MYAGSDSNVLNVHMQHADLGCRRKRGARKHETRVRNSNPNKLRSCTGRTFRREMFPVLCGALGCRDFFLRLAELDVAYARKERCRRGKTRHQGQAERSLQGHELMGILALEEMGAKRKQRGSF